MIHILDITALRTRNKALFHIRRKRPNLLFRLHTSIAEALPSYIFLILSAVSSIHLSLESQHVVDHKSIPSENNVVTNVILKCAKSSPSTLELADTLRTQRAILGKVELLSEFTSQPCREFSRVVCAQDSQPDGQKNC